MFYLLYGSLAVNDFCTGQPALVCLGCVTLHQCALQMLDNIFAVDIPTDWFLAGKLKDVYLL